MKKLVLALVASMTLFASAARADVLCADKIVNFTAQKFPHENFEGKLYPIQWVIIHKSTYRPASVDVDIEVHSLYDNPGYIARRIFIGADAVVNDDGDAVDCTNFVVKASYFDPIAE